MAFAVDLHLSGKGSQLGLPAIGAQVRGDGSASILEITIARHVGSAVRMIYIHLVAVEAHFSKAQGDIALTMDLHLIEVDPGIVAGDGKQCVVSRELHKNITPQIVNTLQGIEGAGVAFNGGLHCQTKGGQHQENHD